MKVFGKKIICLVAKLPTLIQIIQKLENIKDSYQKEKSMGKVFIFGEELLMRVNSLMIVLKAKAQLSSEKLSLKPILNPKGIF